jgi:hypothetical protein
MERSDSVKWGILFLILLCLTIKQINDIKCDTLCKKDHDAGYFSKNSCICQSNAGKLQDFLKGQIRLDDNNYFRPETTPPPAASFQ